MRKGTIIIWLSLLFTGIIAFFWYTDWVYRLPTPVPENYQAVTTGTNINLPLKLNSNNSKPVFLHFFNPVCPCSKFNIAHFKSLVKQYQHEVNFAVVVMSTKDYTDKEIQNKFDYTAPGPV